MKHKTYDPSTKIYTGYCEYTGCKEVVQSTLPFRKYCKTHVYRKYKNANKFQKELNKNKKNKKVVLKCKKCNYKMEYTIIE